MQQIHLKNQTVFITGAAGFIGSSLAKRLLVENSELKIIGIDNLNSYYDIELKQARLEELSKWQKFYFIKEDIADKERILSLFDKYRPQIVIHLAAQAGVRYSVENPDAYIQSNLVGFFHILEGCRQYGTQHLIYASSSSVYGKNEKVPYATEDKTDQPISLYAATKKSNELMAYSYSDLYQIPMTGLRFFTVYGPAGRPDMAYFSFADKMRNGKKIQIFNYGQCWRDFTYIDDIVEGIVRIIQGVPERTETEKGAWLPPHKIYNIGNSHPEKLLDFVQILQEELVRAGALDKNYDFEGCKELVPMQLGDVPVTYADTKALEEDFGFKPVTELRQGLRKFAEWYAVYCRQKEL